MLSLDELYKELENLDLWEFNVDTNRLELRIAFNDLSMLDLVKEVLNISRDLEINISKDFILISMTDVDKQKLLIAKKIEDIVKNEESKNNS